MKGPLVLGVFASGRGSNLEAILEAIEAGKLPARVAVVLSDRPEAPALEKARRRGIPGLAVLPGDFPSRQVYEERLVEICRQHGVELVVLAGFMRLLGPTFLSAYRHRVMNIHPALLPSFPGLHAQEQAVRYGVRFSGCTVHFVDEGMDTGPIILQAVVPVEQDDTPETLAARILVEEHRLYPEAIRLYAEGRLRIEGRRVLIAPPER
ncbi:MAG: phosphoribosylglycinamide formyltransferase [Bacillota bacterium]|nr:phosphoribosylglycinamide formyltransferase [Bacillota bacterium]